MKKIKTPLRIYFTKIFPLLIVLLICNFRFFAQNISNETIADANFCIQKKIIGEYIKILASDNETKLMNFQLNIAEIYKEYLNIDPNNSPETKIFTVQDKHNKIVSFNYPTYSKLWELQIEGAVLYSGIHLEDKLIVLSTSQNLNQNSNSNSNFKKDPIGDEDNLVLRSINSITGIPELTIKIPQSKNSVANKDSMIEKHSITEGKSDKNNFPNSRNNSVTYTFSHTLITGDDKGLITAEKPDNSYIWSLRVGGAVTSILGSGKNIFVNSKDNFVYSINAISGKINWKYRLSGRMRYTNLQIEDMIILFPGEKDSILFVNKEDGKLLNQIDFPENVFIGGQPAIKFGTVWLPTNAGIFSLIPCSVR